MSNWSAKKIGRVQEIVTEMAVILGVSVDRRTPLLASEILVKKKAIH